MKKTEIILVGGGGHCKSCIDVIEQEGKYQIKGIIDLPEFKSQNVLGYPVIGVDNDLPDLVKEGYHFLVTLGYLGNSSVRENLFNFIDNNGGHLPTIISPLAYVSKHSKIGRGTIIMHHAIINANTEIGENCIINTKVLIEHDCVIGNHNHVSTSTVINGSCRIGDSCLIGSSSVLKHNLSIVSNCIIGQGSVIVKDISKEGIYFGNPVKIKE
jgi:sugar O-acyltransferase (sialic acid O-acetyltransferase NeuD family)